MIVSKMEKKTHIIVLVIILCLLAFTNLSCAEKNHSSAKERARAKFSNATTELTTLGGIASFVSPSGQMSFPKSKIQDLTDRELKEKLNKIIEDLKDAINLDPGLTEAYYFLGVAYARTQNTDKAIEVFEKAIIVEPQREMSYVLLCALLWDKENFEAAIRVSSAFIERFPEKKTEGFLLLGTTYYKQGNFKKAVKIGKEIISLDEKNIEGHLLLASAYFFLGDKVMSETEFETIILIRPQMKNEIEQLKAKLYKQ